MAKYRQIHTNFWNDGFVLDLTPEEKYFYLYIMTNPGTAQCGIYELPKRIIETQTGYNRDTIDKLLNRFIEYQKIEYCNETKEIMIINWMRYNKPTNCNAIKCVNSELKNLKCTKYINEVYKHCKDLSLNIKLIFEGLDDYVDEDGICEQDEANEVISIFESNVYALTPIQQNKVKEWVKLYATDVIILAIEEAVNNNVKNIKYIDKILRIWSKKGLYTVEAIKKYMIEWRISKENKEDSGERKYDIKAIERGLLGLDNDENICD
ncbi:DnaD domain-containing protein [Clostridium botulinum]|uniref:DnaD domain-containing protein n=1 Tax=Clostridium botulinum TaxID=1491 RepID=UPI0004D7BBAD|nr:DnaD domain protein [Clostridium botulinum]KEI00088.1 chromosomal replication initiator protein DnaA [Clostridium botulinum C/D str. BKT75002]KEI05939.1 chromosomal replication initiator protein DnaA [Clostridium botulinum C/D str. BKT2873]MCD3351846.1 DnaD domain protein [Clostridium botulinum D/C]MCD3360811.1 DnaD domain protein [Clostridium botulinum D/C]MCD3362602.1 DnaD domain protein [Clostridium botulinum D/C]